jgi:hypothetical protein
MVLIPPLSRVHRIVWRAPVSPWLGVNLGVKPGEISNRKRVVRQRGALQVAIRNTVNTWQYALPAVLEHLAYQTLLYQP